MIRSLLVLLLTLPFVASVPAAQEDETMLGRPSPIQPSNRERQSLRVEAGSRLHQQPRSDSPVLEILGLSVDLPVLERQGPWVKVRFGNWQGWVRPEADGSGSDPELPFSITPDEERLARARALFANDVEPTSLGPYTAYTDVKDEGLLAWLGAVAEDVSPAYRQRFGLDPGAGAGEVVVLFAEETDYRKFEAAEARIARADSRGYTSEGLSVMFTGKHTRTSLVSVFIHELVHLLNRRVFRAEIPPWLEEGMAEDLAFNRVTPQGRIRLGTLTGVPRQGLGDSHALSEPRAHVAALVARWSTSTRPDLATLVTMDWEDFIQPDRRAIHYTESALLLRYFLDGEETDLRRAFLDYLSTMAQVELTATVSLWNTLDTGPQEIEEELHRFLLRQARAHGLG